MSLSRELSAIDPELAKRVGEGSFLRKITMSDAEREVEVDARSLKYPGMFALIECLRDTTIKEGGMIAGSEMDELFMQLSELVLDAVIDIAEVQEMPSV